MILGSNESDGDGDAVPARVSKLNSHQRMRMWRELAAARRSDRSVAPRLAPSLSQQVEEVAAQVEFLREEIESVLSRVKRRR